MSYCYDVMAKAWATLAEQLPPAVQQGELAIRFGFLIEDMHEANHQVKDAINHDRRVSACAAKLDQVLKS